MPDLTPQIEQAAEEPKTATSDGQSATHHDLTDLIEADQYLKGADALDGENQNGGPRTGWALLRIARHKPTGGGPC